MQKDAVTASVFMFMCHGCTCCRSREEAQASAYAAVAQALQCEPPHAYSAHVAHMTAALDSLVAAVQAGAKPLGAAAGGAAAGSQGVSRSSSRSSSRGPAGSAVGAWRGSSTAGQVLGTAAAAAGGQFARGGDASWVAGVVVRLKELLLESDR
jgi:hypothetical protein